MDEIMQLFSILAVPLGYVMRWIYLLVQNYGWAIIIFTLLSRVLMFPLTMKQQKSTARMAAYQPMIKEIQKKWANDKNKQNAEMQKFYEENNISMSAGCAPMLVNMLVLFGIIAVIQAPLTYVLQIPESQVNAGIALVQHYDPSSEIGANSAGYTRQSQLMAAVRENPTNFTTGAEVPTVNGAPYVLAQGESYKDGKVYKEDGSIAHENAPPQLVKLTSAEVDSITQFKFSFIGLNLAAAPSFGNWVTLIMPILSVLTMLASQVIIMKTSPTPQGKGQMIVMTVLFGVMFGFFAFSVPAGFSLYYTASNVVMTLQQLLVKRIYDPEKIRAEVEAEIAERRAAKKAKKKVAVITEDGQSIDQDLSESEIARLRLAKARELDAQRYSGDADDDKAKAASKLAAQRDAEKYGEAPTPGDADEIPEMEEAESAPETETYVPAGEAAGEAADKPAAQESAPVPAAPKKAGRRKRATQKKVAEDNADNSFAQKELEAEKIPQEEE